EDRFAAQEPPPRIFHYCLCGSRAAGRRPGHPVLRVHPAHHPLRGLDLALGAARPPLQAHAESRRARSRDVTAISADWVLPVDGPPLRDAHVAWEDGRIVDVSAGRAERHFAGAMILPGLVNAHSHLEYAVYAGFGDGRVFGDWLALHITRKRALDHE